VVGTGDLLHDLEGGRSTLTTGVTNVATGDIMPAIATDTREIVAGLVRALVVVPETDVVVRGAHRALVLAVARVPGHGRAPIRLDAAALAAATANLSRGPAAARRPRRMDLPLRTRIEAFFVVYSRCS